MSFTVATAKKNNDEVNFNNFNIRRKELFGILSELDKAKRDSKFPFDQQTETNILLHELNVTAALIFDLMVMTSGIPVKKNEGSGDVQ